MKRIRIGVLIVAISLLALSLANCGSSSPDATGAAKAQISPSTIVSDAHTQASCGAYRALEVRESKSSLTASQILGELKKIDEYAKLSSLSDLRTASSLMLQAYTLNDTANFKVGLASFDSLCTALGR